MQMNNLIPKENKIMKPEEAAKLVELVEEPVTEKVVNLGDTAVKHKRVESNIVYGKIMPYGEKELSDLIVKCIAITRELGMWSSDGDRGDYVNIGKDNIKIQLYGGFYGESDLHVLYKDGDNDTEPVLEVTYNYSAVLNKNVQEEFAEEVKKKKYKKIEVKNNSILDGDYFIKFYASGEIDWEKKVHNIYKTIDPKKAKNSYKIEIK